MRDQERRDMLLERIERYRQHLRETAGAGEKPSALMFYGKISGAAETMETLGVLGAEAKEKIISGAWSIYMGKE